MNAQAAYDELLRRAREETLLASCAELLGWDELTYMPSGGVANRAEQLALLAGLQHDKATDPRRGGLLAAVGGAAPLAASCGRGGRRRTPWRTRPRRPGSTSASGAGGSTARRGCRGRWSRNWR